MTASNRRARGVRDVVLRSAADPAVEAATPHRSPTSHKPTLGRGIVWSEFLQHIEEERAAADAAQEAASGVRRLDRPGPPDDEAGAAA